MLQTGENESSLKERRKLLLVTWKNIFILVCNYIFRTWLTNFFLNKTLGLYTSSIASLFSFCGTEGTFSNIRKVSCLQQEVLSKTLSTNTCIYKRCRAAGCCWFPNKALYCKDSHSGAVRIGRGNLLLESNTHTMHNSRFCKYLNLYW